MRSDIAALFPATAMQQGRFLRMPKPKLADAQFLLSMKA